MAASTSKDEGFSLGRTKSLVPWKEQDVGLLAEGKDDVYRPLHMSSGRGLVVEIPKVQPKDVRDTNLEVCSGEGASGFRSPSRGLSDVESLSDPSFQKFISFSKFLGLLVVGYEREIASLLRKMESRKGRTVSIVKKRSSSTPRFARELRNLKCSVNYCNSNKKEELE